MCTPNSAKLTRWAIGLPEFMHAEYFSHVCSVKVKAKNKATITKAKVKATNPFGQGNSHMLPDCAQRTNQHLRSSQVLATSLAMVNSN